MEDESRSLRCIVGQLLFCLVWVLCFWVIQETPLVVVVDQQPVCTTDSGTLKEPPLLLQTAATHALVMAARFVAPKKPALPKHAAVLLEHSVPLMNIVITKAVSVVQRIKPGFARRKRSLDKVVSPSMTLCVAAMGSRMEMLVRHKLQVSLFGTKESASGEAAPTTDEPTTTAQPSAPRMAATPALATRDR